MKHVEYYIYIEIRSSIKIKTEGKLRLPISIGRDNNNKISFNKALAISKHHLKIRLDFDKIVVENLSKNGYILNNKKYKTTQSLAEGDIIEFSGFSNKIVIKSISKKQPRQKIEKADTFVITHNKSKIYQAAQIFQGKIQEQFYLQRILYLTGVLLIIIILVFIQLKFKNNSGEIQNRLTLFERRTNQDIDRLKEQTLKNSNNKLWSGVEKKPLISRAYNSDSMVKNGAKLSIKNFLNKTKDYNIDIIKQQISKNFKTEIVEVVFEYEDYKKVENGFYYNDVFLTPYRRNNFENKLNKITAAFKGKRKSYEMELYKFESPFLRLHLKDANIIPVRKTVENDISNYTVNDKIFFVEFKRSKNLFLFHISDAKIIDVDSQRIVCRFSGDGPNLGAAVFSYKQKILGLVTNVGHNNQCVVKTLSSIYSSIN